MGILDFLGNAMKEAEKGLLALNDTLDAFERMDDQSLINAADQVNNQLLEFNQMSEYEKNSDKNYAQCVQAKKTIEAFLKKRGYRPKTIYVKED